MVTRTVATFNADAEGEGTKFSARISLRLLELPDGKTAFSGPVGVSDFPESLPPGTYRFTFNGHRATILYTTGGGWYLPHTEAIKPIEAD